MPSKTYRAAAEANTLLRPFEALTESKTKMKVVMWELLKGNTQTALLLSYIAWRDLGIIRVTNAIAKESNQSAETNNSKEILEELNDRFQGIGKPK